VRQVIIGMIIGMIAGVIIGATVIRPHINPPTMETAQAVNNVDTPTTANTSRLTPKASTATEEPPAPTEPETVHWRMTSAYTGSLPVLGELPKRIESAISQISDGQFEIKFHEPGTMVPPQDLFEAVRSGTIQAGFSSPALWAEKVPALQLFSSIPFGPQTREFLAWFRQGGGQEIYDDIYDKQGLHGLVCGVTSPEASGWFKKPVSTPDDLKGLRMRITGLGARVMEKLGVSTEMLMNADIIVAMNSGAIDAAEFSQPAMDFSLGLHRTAGIVYFPGWHQPTTLYDLMINKKAWQALSDPAKAQIEAVCGDNIWRGLTAADSKQFGALKRYTKLGIQMKTWGPELLLAFHNAWNQVAKELSDKDKDFRRAWNSLQKFREEFGIWDELSAP